MFTKSQELFPVFMEKKIGRTWKRIIVAETESIEQSRVLAQALAKPHHIINDNNNREIYLLDRKRNIL